MNLPTDKDGDVLFCTVKTYKLFLAHGRLGMEALALYMHLIFTARLQGMNRIKATDKYLMKGLQIGERKLRSLKAFLKTLGLIDYIQDRGDGRIKGFHIHVNFPSQENSGEANSAPVEQKSCSTGANTARAEIAPHKFLRLTMKKETTEAKIAPLAPPAEPADLPARSPGPPVDSSQKEDRLERSPVVGRLLKDLCDQMKQGRTPDVQLKLGPIGEVGDKPKGKAEERSEKENREGQAAG